MKEFVIDNKGHKCIFGFFIFLLISAEWNTGTHTVMYFYKN